MIVNSRIYRISGAIQHVIIKLLHNKVRDPRLKSISITSVELSRNLGCAKVYFYMSNRRKDTLQLLKAASGFFRTNIAKELQLRSTPALSFIYDNSLIYGEQMNKLIDEALTADGKLMEINV